MIINNRKGKNILNGNERQIAFAVNTEGVNTKGFAGEIARRYWPELANIGECKLGTVLTKKVDGITFYGLVCYSIEKGWRAQTETICKCFNSIKTDEPIASVSVGKGLMEIRGGARYSDLLIGMEKSCQKIILY